MILCSDKDLESNSRGVVVHLDNNYEWYTYWLYKITLETDNENGHIWYFFSFFFTKIPNSWDDNNNEVVDLIDELCDKRLKRVDIKFNDGMLI